MSLTLTLPLDELVRPMEAKGLSQRQRRSSGRTTYLLEELTECTETSDEKGSTNLMYFMSIHRD